MKSSECQPFTLKLNGWRLKVKHSKRRSKGQCFWMLTWLHLPVITKKYLLTCMPEKSSYRPVSVHDKKSVCPSSMQRVGVYILLSYVCICFWHAKPVIQSLWSSFAIELVFDKLSVLYIFILIGKQEKVHCSEAKIILSDFTITSPLDCTFMDKIQWYFLATWNCRCLVGL